jgi:hypothetical protein
VLEKMVRERGKNKLFFISNLLVAIQISGIVKSITGFLINSI